MYPTKHQIRLGLTALTALALLPSATWAAEGTAEEIRLLKARLQQLEAKVAHQERAEKARAKEAKAVPPAPILATSGGVGPDHFYFKGIEITPGGYIAAQTVWRSAWMGADMSTPWGAFPMASCPARIPANSA